jgi:LacI family transcriptional regulator
MPTMPDAFVCANDFLAIHLMTALKAKGISMPEDAMVAGFGCGPEASIIEPTLTTAKIPSSDIGKLAATVLSRRIQQPGFPLLLNYVQTTPIWGDSTR